MVRSDLQPEGRTEGATRAAACGLSDLLCPDQDFWKLRGVHGVEGIVRNDSQPVKIPSGSLARLLDREASGEFDFTRLPDVGPQYQPGEIVRLSAGALTDITGHVLGMLSKGRVEVLIDFMGRASKVKVKANELQRLEAAE
jgi:transcription antitermination factor NusG